MADSALCCLMLRAHEGAGLDGAYSGKQKDSQQWCVTADATFSSSVAAGEHIQEKFTVARPLLSISPSMAGKLEVAQK